MSKCFLKTLTALFVIFAFVIPASTFAQEKPKWKVSEPTGLAYSSVNFETNEGTWLNVDASPDGKTLVFDLLGDIYTMPISGGKATCIRSGIAWEVQPRFSPDGKQILFTSDGGGGDNIWIMKADGSDANPVTKESFRLLNNATWMPDGQYIVARKHFTNTRSLGAGEMWMYHISGGGGIQLTKRKNDQQDVNEPSVTPDGKYLYFSEDMYPGGFFQYNKDPNDQIFVLRRYEFKTGEITSITGGGGGACRPQVSRSGRYVAFVRRVGGTKSCLFVYDSETAEEFMVYDGLDKDQQEAWTTFGVYPQFTWLPGDKTIVIWAAGQLQRIELPAKFGTKATAQAIPMEVPVTMDLAETVRSPQTVFEDKFTSKAIRQLTTSPDGKSIVFHAAGFLYRKNLPDGTPVRLTSDSDFEFEPAFSPDGKQLLYVTWSDSIMGRLMLMDVASGKSQQLNNKKGIYRTPSWSADGKKILFRRDSGDDELGYAHTTIPGVYQMDLSSREAKFLFDDGENPRYTADGQRIYVNTGGYLFGSLAKSLKSYDLNGKDPQTHFTTKYANQWAPSPDGKWLAFTELHKAYICPMPAAGQSLDLSGGMESVPVAQVSKFAGYNLHWDKESQNLFWNLGETYFKTELKNKFSFIPDAPDSLPGLDSTGLSIGLKLEADVPTGYVVLTNARIITMEGNEVIENGTIVIKNNKIESVGKNLPLPTGAQVYDCTGKTILPGYIDVHAHTGNFRYGLSPQKQWEYWANLAYGVTTCHDPSANSEMVFAHSEMLKSGRMVGPRLFSTGTILYGADGDFKASINSYDDAYAALKRTQAFGAFSVKSYNQPRREQRQQVMAAAKALNMLVVPEGGSFFYHNMTQVVDGHTGVEHNIPIAPLYNDVVKMWSLTKTHNTPTLIVCYGALNGENYWYQNTDVWKKQRLLRFTPKTELYSRSRHVTKAPDEEYQNGHILVSKSCKKLQDSGVNINMGSHGQLQGLGAHWELWMLQQGGMSNMQALRSATLNGAQYLGMESEIGSIKAGKLADLQVLDANPLDDIRNSEQIKYVIMNGRVYEAETLTELGKQARKPRTPFWFELPGSQVNGQMQGRGHNSSRCVCGH